MIALTTVSIISAQQNLFPDLQGFKKTSEYPVYTPEDLWNYINGAADAYLALGFIDLNIMEYVKGKQIIKAELYRFGDDARSFGMYSMERSPGYSFINIGVQGYAEEGVLNFYKGNYYVKLMTHSGKTSTNEMMKVLAGRIAAVIEGSNSFPALLGLFPQEGLLENQEAYLLESVLGHDFLSGAFRASYVTEGKKFDIYLFECPDATTAVSYLQKLAGEAFTPDDPFKYSFEDGYNGTLYLGQKGERIVIITGLDRESTGIADRYINRMLTE